MAFSDADPHDLFGRTILSASGVLARPPKASEPQAIISSFAPQRETLPACISSHWQIPVVWTAEAQTQYQAILCRCSVVIPRGTFSAHPVER